MKKIILLLLILLVCISNTNIKEKRYESVEIIQETKEILGKINKELPLKTCGFNKMNIRNLKYINQSYKSYY